MRMSCQHSTPCLRLAWWKMDAKSKDRLAANAGKRHKPISVAQASPALPPTSPTDQPARMAAAKAPARQPGVLLDYILINSTQTNFTFIGYTTYYATNYVALYGTTTLEGGAVAKGIQHDGGPYTGTFIVYGAFDCRTSPYRPAIFTAADDDTVGNLISGSTSTPTNLYRGSLWFDTTNSVVLDNVGIRGWSANLTAEHLTTDGTILFFQSSTNANYTTPSTMTVTNSLLVNVY